jgi:hypothetical protein
VSGEDLLNNNGLLVLGERPAKLETTPRTILVLGPARSGTSVIAGVLHFLGVYMGKTAGPPVYEDTHLARAFEERRTAASKAIIADYDRRHPIWGYKRPALLEIVETVQHKFRNPIFIVSFKDVFSIANRNKISAKASILPCMNKAIAEYRMISNFIEMRQPYSLLVSYEKALSQRQDFVRTVADFCCISPTDEQVQAAIDFVTPNPKEYLELSRVTRAKGRLECVSESTVGGWARYINDERHARVVLSVNGVEVGATWANKFCQGLLDAKVSSTGKCAFEFSNIQPGVITKGSRISVRVIDDIHDLAGCPHVYDAGSDRADGVSGCWRFGEPQGE